MASKKDNYIMYNGERLDLSKWVPMHVKAKELKVNEAYVRQLVHRTREGIGKKRIDHKEIKELGITLVPADFTNS
jgi:hypothetical protein